MTSQRIISQLGAKQIYYQLIKIISFQFTLSSWAVRRCSWKKSDMAYLRQDVRVVLWDLKDIWAHVWGEPEELYTSRASRKNHATASSRVPALSPSLAKYRDECPLPWYLFICRIRTIRLQVFVKKSSLHGLVETGERLSHHSLRPLLKRKSIWHL